MKLQKVEIEGFKSFKEYQEFNFDLDNGLYFVTGENKVESNLGANGAGKSALFEAICWCLYGKTSTNLKASNVVSWENKGCRVGLSFDNGDNIFRQQAPNLLQLNSSPVTQDELEKHLNNLGFESFLYSTFISQFSSKFFDLSPADKMVVFSDIMEDVLKPWELRSIQAKTKAVQMDVTAKGMERVMDELKGSLNHANQLNYSKQIEEFETNKKIALKKAKDRLEKLQDKNVKTKIDLQIVMKERAKIQMAQKQTKFIISPEEYDELKIQKDKARDLYSTFKATYQALENDLEKMVGTLKKGAGICPTCKQMVDKKHLNDEIDSCKRQMAIAEKNYNDYGTMLREKAEEINKIDKAIGEQKDEESGRQSQLRVLENKIENINQNLEYTRIEIGRQETDIQDIDGMENNYVKLEKERQDDIKKFSNAIKDNEDLLGEAKKEFDAYTYWVGGFKSIRLLLLLDSLKEFEVSINNNLSKFGMGDWNVKLDIDQENKSGTIRKGFSVLVQSPSHNGFVPFEVWSGGEGQRLRLAGTVGLMDLIQSKRQINFGIEIFDEPTAWLSDKGIDDLVQALYYRAKENEKKIFLVDHKNLNSFGGFAGTINVVKDEKGSRIHGN